MSAQDARPARDAAVIDIGSNSVRLVIYRLEGRAIWTVFNEKVLAGLGSEVAETRRLAPAGVQTALVALRRFKAVLDAVKPTEVFVVATAAVREAADGPDFIRQLKAEAGLKVRVLTGEEEARYAALGVLAGQPDASGVVGDMGGSSLELTLVEGGKPGAGVSLPLGAFALRGPDGFRSQSRPGPHRQGARRRQPFVRRRDPLCRRRRLAKPSAFADAAGRLSAGDRAPIRDRRRRRAHRRPLYRPPVQGFAGADRGRLQAPAGDHPLRRRGAGGHDRAAGAAADIRLGLRPARGASARSHAGAGARAGPADRGLRGPWRAPGAERRPGAGAGNLAGNRPSPRWRRPFRAASPP